MNVIDKIKDFVAPEEETDDVLELTEEEAKNLKGYEAPKNKNVSKISSDAKMVLFEPRSFEEAEEIGTHLKERKAAVVNLHRLPHDASLRVIDFLTGVCFALNGTISKVGTNVILCAPASIGVDGEINVDEVGY